MEKGRGGGRECEKINVLSLFLPQVFQIDTNLCVCDCVCLTVGVCGCVCVRYGEGGDSACACVCFDVDVLSLNVTFLSLCLQRGVSGLI